MASYRVSTQAYSGPFDLLLQLVSRQRVTIGSISIAEVASQYLDEVERMRDLDLDVASDFVLVASTLLDIKAASLVPDEPAAPSGDDLGEEGDADLDGLSPDEAREVLIARLIAYKQFRSAAAARGASDRSSEGLGEEGVPVCAAQLFPSLCGILGAFKKSKDGGPGAAHVGPQRLRGSGTQVQIF